MVNQGKLRGTRLHMAVSDAIDLIQSATKRDLKVMFGSRSLYDIKMEVLNPLLAIQSYLDEAGIKNPEKILEKIGEENG